MKTLIILIRLEYQDSATEQKRRNSEISTFENTKNTYKKQNIM
jgi:hypothetical protein